MIALEWAALIAVGFGLLGFVSGRWLGVRLGRIEERRRLADPYSRVTL